MNGQLLITDWPIIPDRFGVLPKGYELRYCDELGIIAVWSPEFEKHVALQVNNSGPYELEMAVAILDRACWSGLLN